MFRKLISNLPFNPSLLGTVSFYAQRMRSEASLRRLGFGFMALAMFIQLFAVMAPPEKSLAYSSDYIINGLRTRDDILRAWDGKTADRNVAEIYQRFGLTRADIEALPMHPNVTVHSNYADYWTIGRTSLSAVSKAGQIKSIYKNNEVPINTGSTTVYLRQLRAWDIKNPVNTYRAFEGWKNGKQFWILVDCGNFTQVGKPSLKPPALQFRKSIDGGSRSLKPGDEFNFRFEYRNSVQDSQPVQNAVLYDAFDLEKYDIVSKPANAQMTGERTMMLPLGNVPYTANFQLAGIVKVRLKTSLNNGDKTCNSAFIRSSNATEVKSGGNNLCITVAKPPAPKPPKPQPKPCPYDSSITESDERCEAPVLACKLTEVDVNRTTRTFTLKTTVSTSNQHLTSVQSYVYDFGDGSAVQTRKSSALTDQITHTYKEGSFTATVVVTYKSGKGSTQTDKEIACSANIDSEPDQPLSQSKSARNLTQSLNTTDTLKATAKAGDTIEYSLVMHNSYDYDRTGVAMSDFIGDILDYATLDKAYLTQQGGSFNEQTKTISWQNQTVKADSELTKMFRVQMKDPIPSTNQPSAMTTSYDCLISNKFGNQIDLKVDCPLPKEAEYVTSSLPKTGPGTSLLIGFVGTSVIAYFFARSRLLAQELDIIRTDFASTGGI